MAQDKKSFIAYADWKNIFDELPDEDAGKLIKHIFSYVNDENPNSDSVLIRAVFANIKSTLKRDLDKWDNQLNQRKLAGKKSADVRKNNSLKEINYRSTTVDETTRNPTDNVSVSVSVNDNVILLEKETKENFENEKSVDEIPEEESYDKPPAFNFKKKLIEAGAEISKVEEWLIIRKRKKAVDNESALNLFFREIKKSGLKINEALEICNSESWKGFKAEYLLPKHYGKSPTSNKTGYQFDLDRAIESAQSRSD